MPKRAWDRNRANSRASSDGEAEGAGHTPKWIRSSPSESPEPSSNSGSKSVEKEIMNEQEMQCILPGHLPLVLASAAEFEAHYARDHTNQCIACKANLPSLWMLELHHQERHDPLVAAKRDSGEKTYQCFLQDCEKVTLTAQKRRLHLIDKHEYPKNYNFSVIDWGLKGKRSLLQDPKVPSKGPVEASSTGTTAPRDKSSDVTHKQSVSGAQGRNTKQQPNTSGASVPPQKQDASSSQEDAALDGLSKAMSSLMFVPMSVQRKNKKNT